MDAAPGSRWAWCRGEETQVERAGKRPGPSCTVARDETFMGAEQFHDYRELAGSLPPREPTLSRIEEFKGREGIAIQMPYRIVLLR